VFASVFYLHILNCNITILSGIFIAAVCKCLTSRAALMWQQSPSENWQNVTELFYTLPLFVTS